MSEGWRPISYREREIVEKMLSSGFAGSEILRLQLQHAAVKEVLEDGTLEFRIPADLPLASIPVRVPVEAEVLDADGTPILILLHVVDGKLHELEIVKGDDSMIKCAPHADSILVRSKA